MDYSIFNNQDARDIIIKIIPRAKSIFNSFDNITIKLGECTSCKKKKLFNKLKRLINNLDTETKNKVRDALDISIYNNLIYPIPPKNDSPQMQKIIRFEDALKPREKCEDCVKKHLYSCLILLTEFQEGYEDHIYYAESEFLQAVNEGCELILTFTKDNIESIIQHIKLYLGVQQDSTYIIGLFNTLEKTIDDIDDKEKIREMRKKYMNIDDNIINYI